MKALSNLEILGLRSLNGGLQGASDAQVTEAERQFGFRFPNEYRFFLQQCGVSLFAEEVVFTALEPSPWAVGDNECLDIFYGISEKTGFDLKHINERLKGDIPRDSIAIGHDSGSNLILLNLETGQIRFFDKDTGKTYLIANNFDGFLKSFRLRK